jgi:hypothetical protein
MREVRPRRASRYVTDRRRRVQAQAQAEAAAQHRTARHGTARHGARWAAGEGRRDGCSRAGLCRQVASRNELPHVADCTLHASRLTPHTSRFTLPHTHDQPAASASTAPLRVMSASGQYQQVTVTVMPTADGGKWPPRLRWLPGNLGTASEWPPRKC